MANKENANALTVAYDLIKTPKDLPEGVEFQFAVKGYVTGESPDKKTPYVDIKAVAIEAISEDIDGVEGAYWPVTHRFWTTEKAIGQLKTFLVGTLGLPEKDAAGNYANAAEQLEEAVGLAFNAVVGIEMRGKNKDRPSRILVGIRPATE